MCEIGDLSPGDYVRVDDAGSAYHGQRGIVDTVRNTEDVQGVVVRVLPNKGHLIFGPQQLSKREDGTSHPPRISRPEYSNPYFVPVVRGEGLETEFADGRRWDCLSCGAMVSDPARHDKFHELLVRQACRG